MPGDDERPGQALKERVQVGGVAVEAAQGDGRCGDEVTGLLQAVGDAAPDRGVGEGAVDEDERRPVGNGKYSDQETGTNESALVRGAVTGVSSPVRTS